MERPYPSSDESVPENFGDAPVAPVAPPVDETDDLPY